MTSSTLTGDRRYAPARRGGMTSLGKIAVPKPINLPSQRLENHGLDPNVEIVPKGTHSWGTRSSSSTPNAWGSSTLSPNTDGGSGSPSHLSGRPSSGGSGTRPSTASSDRTHDPIASAWGTNSRPSSASGALTSNQTSFTSLRPCSAETRPGSSQLSRFAEPLSDNSAAWVATGTAEKLGGTSSKNEGFSLTSGDFPTLGSEKENSGKNTESQDHDSYSRPGSSSGGVAPGKESAENSAGDASLNTNAKMEPANSWRRENPMCGEDGLRPSMEKWHPDHQLYPNSNIRPQNYDSWHAPPVNNPPGGVWYRGPPGGPPFAPPIAPGGFPMEPFPYYCPQIPPTALANPQQGPPPGPGPRGSHPTNGDMYRPHMHDAFMRPGMPFRPGFYPGPVPYEGYYASHMGYCNSNDRDIQFMGMAVGPAPYNRFSGQNAPDPGNSHGRPGGYGPPSGHTMVPEQLESGHPQDTRGPCKVLLRQHDGLEGKDKEQKWDDMMATNASYPGKADHQRKSSWENGWSADEKNNKERNTRRMGEEFSSEAKGNQGGVKVKPLEHVGNWKAADDSSVKKLEHAASGFPEVSTAPKDPSLIRKIEGLNAKARASDGRQEVKFASGREEHKNRLQGGNARSNHSANEAGNSYASLERTHVCGISDTASHEDHIFAADKSHEVTGAIGTASSRRSTHGMHGRPVHHGKGRFSTQEAEGWRRRSHVADLPSVLSSSHFESSNVHRQDHNPTEATEKSGSYHQGKDDGESVLPHPDPSDSQSAKMKELAIQRVKQREKEEEERARDQKAKALAKLAELLEEERARDNESVIPMVDNTNVQFHRRSTHGMHGRPDHHGKGRFSTQEAEGWRRRSHVADLPSVLSSSHFESSNVHRQDHNPTEATEKSGSYHQGKDDGESVLPHPDPSDSQRAKMKELAIQRVKQREKEEEERARDQKAKALAKLAELNKRTKAAESLSELLPGMPKATPKESVVIHDQLEPLQQEASRADGDHPDNAPETYDNRASKQKRVSYRQKLNGPLEKTCNDKLMTTDVAANAPVSIEGANEMTTSPESTLPINPTATTESSVHHGRRKNKNGKKYKVEEASSMAVVVTATLSKEITAIDISVESSKSKASESASDPSAQTDSRDGNQSLDQHTSSPNEEVQGRVNNQWKSQYSRRMPRNPQANKSTEKFQSGDAVIWAPVRSHNKIEATDEASQKTLADAISEPMKSDQQVQNNTRNKRAEMERYIPKSVAKEMAQQGSSPHSAAPLINQITPDETVGRPESRSLGNESSQSSATGMGKVVSILESKNGDGRQNKSGKRYGSWRQRGSSESTMFFTSKNVQKSIEHQVQKPDVSSAKEQLGHSDEWSDSDGWNIPEKSEVPITVPAIKDHGATARGRRQSYRGNKGMGCSHDPDEKIINTGDAEKVHVQTLGSEMHQADSAATSKENRAVGERPASHWQPKSQPISATNHPGSRASGGQNTGSEVARGNKKDSTSQNGMPVLPQPDKDIAAEAQSHPDGSLSARSNLEEDPSTGHQEGKKERKIASHKGHPAEPSPLNMDFQQRVSSGFRKNGNQNSRFGREYDSRGGEWGGSGKDNEHHNRERQRQNSHYEYQPVGPQYNNKANNYESSKDGSHNSVARSRERGQSNSRRGGGNSHGRQPGGARVDANYD